MPRQYFSQFRERVVALVQDGRDASDLASELGISAARMCRRRRQARINAVEIADVDTALASELSDARRQVWDLEE